MGSVKYNLQDQTFSYLTVEEYAGKGRWLCICICGNKKVVRGSHLRSNGTQSCGCKKKELIGKRLTKHGLFGHPLYYVYTAMIDRCNNPNNKQYKDYGGRGIRVCEKWSSDIKTFFEDMLPSWKLGLILDRIDNNGSYSLENCRFTNRNISNHNIRSKKGTSCFKGVHWNINYQKWVTQITINNKQICIGKFNSEKDAAEAYDNASMEYYKEFASTNQV